VKDVQTLPGADIDCDHKLLVATICTRLKKIIRFHKGEPRWDLEKLYAQRQEVQDSLEDKLGAIKFESWNVEVQWDNIKMCVRHCEWFGWKSREESKKAKDYTGDDSKMDERRKWKNVDNEEGRKNYRRLRNELKRATDNAKKEYLERIYDEIIEFKKNRTL
jgi:hypothetical protein